MSFQKIYNVQPNGPKTLESKYGGVADQRQARPNHETRRHDAVAATKPAFTREGRDRELVRELSASEAAGGGTTPHMQRQRDHPARVPTRDGRSHLSSVSTQPPSSAPSIASCCPPAAGI